MAKAQKQEKTMEAALWEAANKLRGAVEPAEYKHVVAEYKYPPVTQDEVYKEVLEQAENFRKYAT